MILKNLSKRKEVLEVERKPFMQKTAGKMCVLATAVVFAGSLFNCLQPPKNFINPNVSVDDYFTIAHAGGGMRNSKGTFLRYLNCEESFYNYYENGTRMFEYDLVFTLDGNLVGTHKFEYLKGYSFDRRISYEDYLETKIAGEFTGITSDKILDLIKNYPDAKFILDTKEKYEMGVYKEFIKQANEKNIDISKNVIPLVTSREMLEEIEKTYQFDEYMFSVYKNFENTKEILKIVNKAPKIKYLHIFPIDIYRLDISSINKAGIRVFAHMDNEDVFSTPISFGCSGIFTDNITENEFKETRLNKIKNKFGLVEEETSFQIKETKSPQFAN